MRSFFYLKSWCKMIFFSPWKNHAFWVRKKNFFFFFELFRSCLVCIFPSWVVVLKLSKKSKSNKAIYIYVSERSRYELSENCVVYYAMVYCFGDIRALYQRILLNFCWVTIFFYILSANISWALAQNPMNLIIFWMSIMKTLRYIHVNYFNRLKFLANISTKLQKLTFMDSLRNIDQEANMETRQMSSFPSFFFSTLSICNINFSYNLVCKISLF